VDTIRNGSVKARRSLRGLRTVRVRVDAVALLTWLTTSSRTVAISDYSGTVAIGKHLPARHVIRVVSSHRNGEHKQCRHRGDQQTLRECPATAPIGEVLVGQINGMGFFQK
jgi:hypothetical protein